MASADSWWRARRHFLRRAFVTGFATYVWIFGILSLVVGITVLAVVGWVLDRPRLGVELAVVVAVLVLLEGAFQLLTQAERRAEDVESDLAFLQEPHLSVVVDGAQFMPFADQPSEGGYYGIIKVSADREVTNCQGHLTRIVTAGNEIPIHAPIPLRWIASESLSRDLVQGVSYGMTVVFTESTRPNETLISTDSHQPRGVPSALNVGDSRLTVVISADGVPPLECRLRVRAQGEWRALHLSEDDGSPFDRSHAFIGNQPVVTSTSGYTGAGTVPYYEVAAVSAVTASSVASTFAFPYDPQVEPLRVTSAIYGVPGKEVDVASTLNALIDDDWILDFFADNATLVAGNDPAPDEFKKLRMRWVERGVAKASSFAEGTHVVIPDPATSAHKSY